MSGSKGSAGYEGREEGVSCNRQFAADLEMRLDDWLGVVQERKVRICISLPS